MSKIQNENYIVIQGFMVNDLKLKGNELLIYAIIYGFSQDEEQRFTGSLQYLSDWTNSTKQSVLNNLKSLIEKGLISKEEKFINGVKFVEYYSKKFNGGIQKSLIGGIQKSLTNNIVNNNIIDNIEEKYKKEIYYEDKELNDLFIEYLNLRKKIKAVNSDRAIKGLINKLECYSDDVKKEMIDEAIIHSWKSVYPLNKQGKETLEERNRRLGI